MGTSEIRTLWNQLEGGEQHGIRGDDEAHNAPLHRFHALKHPGFQRRKFRLDSQRFMPGSRCLQVAHRDRFGRLTRQVTVFQQADGDDGSEHIWNLTLIGGYYTGGGRSEPIARAPLPSVRCSSSLYLCG